MGTRCKITIQKRETKEKISVAFSKRRAGLYSKATDLCVLGDAKIAIVTTSPGSDDIFYSFGHPYVDEVVDAFLENGHPNGIGEETKPSVLLSYQEAKEKKRDRQRVYDKRMESKKRKRELGLPWEDDDFGLNQKPGESVESAIDRLRELKDKIAIRLKNKKAAIQAQDFDSDMNGGYNCLLSGCSSSNADEDNPPNPTSEPSPNTAAELDCDFVVADLGISMDSFGCGIKSNHENNFWDHVEAGPFPWDETFPLVY